MSSTVGVNYNAIMQILCGQLPYTFVNTLSYRPDLLDVSLLEPGGSKFSHFQKKDVKVLPFW